jgi:prepilin-type N-terminal cleavage/methylation domain-containing protein
MKSRFAARQGFTLVELLIVIVIIVIIVAFTVPAVMSGINKVKVTQIVVELTQLESAIEQYKTENGGVYPPDFTGYPENSVFEAELLAHVGKCFPRCSQNLTTWRDLHLNTANPFKPSTLDPAEALVFWLSMIRSNPQRPLPWFDGTAQDNSSSPPKSYFTFIETRLKDLDGDGWPEYYPINSPFAPYVYFSNRSYSVQGLSVDYGYPRKSISATYPQPAYVGTFGRARPYATKVDPMNQANVLQWAQPAKFQIISAGLDQYFGDETINPNDATLVLPKLFPFGENYTPVVEEDNITNFTNGRTVGGNRP